MTMLMTSLSMQFGLDIWLMERMDVKNLNQCQQQLNNPSGDNNNGLDGNLYIYYVEYMHAKIDQLLYQIS